MGGGCGCGFRQHPYLFPHYLLLLPLALAGTVIAIGPKGLTRRILIVTIAIVAAGFTHLLLLDQGPLFNEPNFFMGLLLIALITVCSGIVLCVTLIARSSPGDADRPISPR